jgi:hypothetical protein
MVKKGFVFMAFLKERRGGTLNDDYTVWENPWHECATALYTADTSRR